MSAMTKRLDLDALLGEPEPEQTNPISLFGRDWDVVVGINSFTVSRIQANDTGAISDFLTNSVIEDQRDDFRKTLAAQKGMKPERLLKLVEVIIEAATEHPTKSPSVSSRSASKRTSAPRSAARSSSARA
jgi:hypothetical protein